MSVAKVRMRRMDWGAIAAVQEELTRIREAGVKKSKQYSVLRSVLVERGFKPFQIMAAFQYVAGAAKGDWPASVKLAAAIANRKRW